MPPHILAVFNQLFDELKSMKQQQWIITNYGAAILAAIYVIKLSGVPHSQTYLKILAGVTAVVGSSFLLWVQCNIVGTRYRLDDVHKNFFISNELEAVGWTDREIRKLYYRPWRRKLAYWRSGLEFTVPLFLSCWAAQSSCVLLCSQSCPFTGSVVHRLPRVQIRLDDNDQLTHLRIYRE